MAKRSSSPLATFIVILGFIAPLIWLVLPPLLMADGGRRHAIGKKDEMDKRFQH